MQAPSLCSVRLTDQQERAVAALLNWWRNRRSTQQVFRVFGFAGTGKTTIIQAFLNAIGVKTQQAAYSQGGGAVFAAYTGKAALQMRRRNGVPATTIHKAIYQPLPENEDETRRVLDELSQVETELGRAGHLSRPMIAARLKHLQDEFARLTGPRFKVREDAPIRHATVIVIDEVSMVGTRLGTDLLSIGVPIIVLGDPGQLPPIGGDVGFFMGGTPDVMLNEIHRQAADSPIIRLSMMAREGRSIPYGVYAPNVVKVQPGTYTPWDMLGADQVLCGLNSTRHAWNVALKLARKLEHPYPLGHRHEKIICTRNNDALNLINGQFLSVKGVALGDALKFTAEIETEDGERTPRVSMYSGFYADHLDYSPKSAEARSRRDHFKKKDLVETTWGWVITTHKAQGSQWPIVVVLDDELYAGKASSRAQWLYKSITRAEDGLAIIA